MALAWRGFLLVAITLAAAPAMGQSWARKMFEETQHEFGAVARGSHAEHRFKFTNLYRDEVHIASVRTSCGCTTPLISERTVKSREQGEIVARYNTDRFSGKRGATITVTIDRPAYAEVQLRVDGYIRTDVVLEPGGVRFGQVDEGQPAEQEVRVLHAGRDDWRIVGVEPELDYLDVSWRQVRDRSAPHAYDVSVRLSPDAPAGYWKRELLLVTNDRRMSRVPLIVEGHVVPQLRVSPSALSLGSVAPGEKIQRQLVVQGKEPFTITAVRCDDEQFEFEVPDTEKKVHIVPLTFHAGQPGKLAQVIRIETDLGSGAVAELTAQATIRPTGANEASDDPELSARSTE